MAKKITLTKLNPHINALREMAMTASEHAYSPYSKAKVGAALLTTDGNYYAGCNVENSSYGATVCAERVAIFQAVSQQKKISIEYIYIYSKDGWPPCGMCRQVLSEFQSPNLIVIIGDKTGTKQIVRFKDLMPMSFTPHFLLKKG